MLCIWCCVCVWWLTWVLCIWCCICVWWLTWVLCIWCCVCVWWLTWVLCIWCCICVWWLTWVLCIWCWVPRCPCASVRPGSSASDIRPAGSSSPPPARTLPCCWRWTRPLMPRSLAAAAPTPVRLNKTDAELVNVKQDQQKFTALMIRAIKCYFLRDEAKTVELGKIVFWSQLRILKIQCQQKTKK